MRFDENYALFAKNTNWFKFIIGIGYVPTKEAPPEAVEAMKNFDFYTYGTPKEKIPMPAGD